MADTRASEAKTSSEYEAELRAASEAVYKHSLELATLTKALEEANQKQETLIHFISHEVKGSLTKDQGTFAALLEGDFGTLPDELRPLVTSALAQVRTGIASVMDILEAANQKRGMAEYIKTPFNLTALVNDAVENARSAAAAKGLELSFSSQAPSLEFVGDKEQIAEHVLRNLLDNAISYTPKGAIDVTLEKKGDTYILTVKDTGIGISAEDMAHLFTEGGHGKDSQRVNVHSTGYGLFIAKNIIEAHGGTIRAESAGPGHGSTFVVELPSD